MFDRSFDGASFDAHEGPMRCCLAVPLSSNCETVADTRRVVGSLKKIVSVSKFLAGRMQWGRAAEGMEAVGPPSDSKCDSVKG